jgi:phosphoadenosine phosphosulfate reductase
VRQPDSIDLEILAKQASRELADAAADEIVRWAVRTFSDRVCVTSSMTDTVIIDLASRVKPGIDVIFLDTGYHFAETLRTRDAAATIYPVNLINVTPSRTVEEQERDLGPRLYGRNPDLCCYLRKVVPLERALELYDAWITGLRGEETTSRRDSHAVEWDSGRKMVKVNPIVAWSQDDVDAYIEAYGVLVNRLVFEGYPSIGCATCTVRAAPGAGPRSGRWPGTSKTECGIHKLSARSPASAHRTALTPRPRFMPGVPSAAHGSRSGLLSITADDRVRCLQRCRRF